MNTQIFGPGLHITPYNMHEDPANTAIRNEHVRIYREGMLRTLTVIDEEIENTQKRIKNLKENR